MTRPTEPNRGPLKILGVLLAGMFVFGFVAAPHSCDWGLNAWFITGVVVGIICVAAPFRFPGARFTRSPIGSAVLLGGACFLVWCLGLLVSGFQLLCRLF